MIITFVVLVFVSLTPAAPTHNHVCPTQKSDTPSTNHTKFIWFPEHPSHARLGSRETKNRNRKMLFLPWSFTSRKRFFISIWIAWWCSARLFAETHFIIKGDQRELKCGKRGVWKVTSGFLELGEMSRWVAKIFWASQENYNFRACVWKVASIRSFADAADADASRTHRDGKHSHDLPFSICWFPPNVDFRLSFPITLVTRARNFVNRVWNPNSIRRCHEHLNLQPIPALAGGWLWGR